MTRVVTVQRTGKFWKLLRGISVLGLGWSTYLIWGSIDQTKPNIDFLVGPLALATSLFGLFVARIGAWWFHA